MLQEIFDIIKRWKVEGDNRPFFTHEGKSPFKLLSSKKSIGHLYLKTNLHVRPRDIEKPCLRARLHENVAVVAIQNVCTLVASGLL